MPLRTCAMRICFASPSAWQTSARSETSGARSGCTSPGTGTLGTTVLRRRIGVWVGWILGGLGLDFGWVGVWVGWIFGGLILGFGGVGVWGGWVFGGFILGWRGVLSPALNL